MTHAMRRVADLHTGDLTSHAGGACCGPGDPFRVEKLDPWDTGTAIDVTWACTGCDRTFEPLPCAPDVRVTFFGSSQPADSGES